MLPTLRNLLTSLPSARDAEMSETLITAHGIRLQRIVSFGQVSPGGSGTTRKRLNGSCFSRDALAL